MYNINDKESATKQVQEYLAYIDDTGIYIAPSGVYDDNTRQAVSTFQQMNNLEVTSEVDKATFDLLYYTYKEKKTRNEVAQAVGSRLSFPMEIGYYSPFMVEVNHIIAELMDYYGHTHRIVRGGYFSEETAAAVRILGGIYLLEENGIIDEIFYNRMILDYDSVKLFNNT